MKRLSVRELRAALPHLDDLLEREGEVHVVRRGNVIARLLPVRQDRTMPSHRDLRASMPQLSIGSENLVRDDRDGR